MEMTREKLLKLIEAKENEPGFSLLRIAKESGVSYDNLKDFKREKSHLLRGDKLQRLLGYLDNMEKNKRVVTTPNDDETIAEIPVYDVAASAGAGVIIHQENIKYHASFRMDWLRRITTAPLEMLAVISVGGDSMQPTLSPEDTVLVDMTQTYPKKDGIYVLRYGDDVLVKRIQIDPVRQHATILSDNPAYPPLDHIRPEEIKVIGRVLWLGRRV